MKYKIQTLGCKVNQFETQALETMLKARGVVPAGESESADVVIVNTCAVTAESGRKSRQAIRRIEGENPGAVVAVCGCYAQISPDDVAETAGLIPNCTLIWYEGMGHMRAASSGRIPRDVLAWTEQLDAAAV